MCGFAGYFTVGRGGVDAEGKRIVERMAAAITHRGPDSVGHWIDASHGVALSHRRLAIVDLSDAGYQPMVSTCGRYMLVFNGEIYNHQCLRDELGRNSYLPAWRGHSDTETLLAGFSIWGGRMTVERCIGMFAFSLWDKKEQTLILARDRLGEKPLYYGWQGRGDSASFLFGSELKALRAHPVFSADINRDALSLYMRHNNVPCPYTIYKDIYKLPPGCILTLSKDNSEPKVKQYWSAADVAMDGVAQPFSGSATDAVDELDKLLQRSISQQMLADVPLGAFLSGGVDSSTIVSLMQAQSLQPVKTFSIGFTESDYDEAIYAKDIAKHLGTDHTELYVSPEQAMSVIPRLPTVYDEPFADSSQIPTYLVSEIARQHVTVSLSGDAGDELFAGYNRYQVTASTWGRLSKVPHWLRQSTKWGIERFSPSQWNKLASLTGLDKRWADIGYKLHKGAGVLGASSVDELYMGLVSHWQDPSSVVLNSEELPTLLTGNQPLLSGLNDVERMMIMDALTYLPDDILTKVDRAAMGVSLETRVPFLDHRVFEFAWSLPLDYKIRHVNGSYITKWALREVLYRRVPKKLIERPKMGFGIPIDAWLRGPLREWAEELLNENRLKQEGFFHSTLIQQKWEEHLSGQRNWQHLLWCVLMFQSWLDEYRCL